MRVFVIFSLLFLATFRVGACSCIEEDEPFSVKINKAYNQSTLIISGTVISKTIAQSNPDVQLSSDIVTYKVQVIKPYKNGKGFDNIEIKSYRDGAFCGVDFEIGQSYLIYAGSNNNEYYTGLCTRTAMARNTRGKEFRILKRAERKRRRRHNRNT